MRLDNKTKENNVFFSIIVPAYNVVDFIGNTVISILNQDFHDFELILVNDGSTDDTFAVCERFASENPERIVLIDQENRGVSAARNSGIEKAKGKYLMFVDGDDYLCDGALSLLHNLLSDCYPDMLYFDFMRTDMMDSTIAIPDDISDRIITETPQEAVKGKLKEKTIPCIAMCIKKTIVTQYNLSFDEDLTYVEDALFLFKCMLNCKSIRHLEYPLYLYFQRRGSATHLKTIPSSVLRMEIKAWKRILKLMSNEKELSEIIKARKKPITKKYIGNRKKEIKKRIKVIIGKK